MGLGSRALREPLPVGKTLTGTTTDSYTNALDWACHGFNNKTILLKNTHTSNSLKYKVLVYAYSGGIEYEEVSETTLAAGDIAKIVLNYAYDVVKVQVKSATAGSAATYQLDYIGNRGG
jgi:hypothetical protein